MGSDDETVRLEEGDDVVVGFEFGISELGIVVNLYIQTHILSASVPGLIVIAAMTQWATGCIQQLEIQPFG
jgi:hypothetical protein